MPKQSATNPRFRCNGCKEFHSAPKQNVHYQCAVHGYICKKYLTNSKSKEIPFKGAIRWKEGIRKKDFGKCSIWDKNDPQYKKKGWYGEPFKVNRVVCLNNIVQFNWHKDVGRWIEKGREEEEKTKAKPKAKSKTKPDYAKEIKVLMDLFEKDILTKEQFLSQLKEKLGL